MSRGDGKWRVYLHILKGDNRAYCGITKQDVRQRWVNGRGYRRCLHFDRAIKKYGWDNFAHVILYVVETREEAVALERLIIWRFHLTDERYGFNIQRGGEDRDQAISPEGLKRLHDTFVGGNSPSAKSVFMFDSDGKKIRSFETAKEAANFIGIKQGTLSGRYLRPDSKCFRGKYYFRFETDVSGKDTLDNVRELRELHAVNKKWKKVNQYDMSGKYLRTYKSVQEASRIANVNCQDLSWCLSGHLDSLGKFMWRFYVEGDHATDDIEPYVRKKAPYHIAHSRHILKIDISTNRIVEEYISIREASDSVRFSRSTLYSVLRTPPHTRDGYKWLYADEYPSEV